MPRREPARPVRAGLVAIALAVTLSACGPMSLERAEDVCLEQARLAAGPRGEVKLGVTSNGGAAAGLELTIDSNYLRGRDPALVYETCVVAKSGEPPTRPLYARPDWKG
jgi:hypothetical protein